MPRVHITGASGTGTTTLGRALAVELDAPHFDSDDYYWSPTSPPYTTKRDPVERDARLEADLAGNPRWVWSGSAMSWRVRTSPTLCVFLTLPAALRVERIRMRERALQVPEPSIEAFLEWAAAYDAGSRSGRSRARHEAWLAGLGLPVLRIDGDRSATERVELVLCALTTPGPSSVNTSGHGEQWNRIRVPGRTYGTFGSPSCS